MIETSKETKAQRAERLKGALNPWSAYAEIERFAREGWDSTTTKETRHVTETGRHCTGLQRRDHPQNKCYRK